MDTDALMDACFEINLGMGFQ